jgi:hypothetical protein
LRAWLPDFAGSHSFSCRLLSFGAFFCAFLPIYANKLN